MARRGAHPHGHHKRSAAHHARTRVAKQKARAKAEPRAKAGPSARQSSISRRSQGDISERGRRRRA